MLAFCNWTVQGSGDWGKLMVNDKGKVNPMIGAAGVWQQCL